jgi:hypothetical protein
MAATPLPPDFEHTTEGLISAETARDIWKTLFQEIHGNSLTGLHGYDPLSTSERKLYEALTANLTARAQLVVVEFFTPDKKT